MNDCRYQPTSQVYILNIHTRLQLVFVRYPCEDGYIVREHKHILVSTTPAISFVFVSPDHRLLRGKRQITQLRQWPRCLCGFKGYHRNCVIHIFPQEPVIRN